MVGDEIPRVALSDLLVAASRDDPVAGTGRHEEVGRVLVYRAEGRAGKGRRGKGQARAGYPSGGARRELNLVPERGDPVYGDAPILGAYDADRVAGAKRVDLAGLRGYGGAVERAVLRQYRDDGLGLGPGADSAEGQGDGQKESMPHIVSFPRRETRPVAVGAARPSLRA